MSFGSEVWAQHTEVVAEDTGFQLLALPLPNADLSMLDMLVTLECDSRPAVFKRQNPKDLGS